MFRLALCALLWGLLAPAPADACSMGLPERTSVSPKAGAVDVPLNTRVIVLYERLYSPVTVTLREAGGDEMIATTTSLPGGVVLEPTTALAPDTTYEILDTLREDCFHIHCGDDEPEVVSTFTTGSVEDLQPPVFSGLHSPIVSPVDRCECDACCGPYVMRRWSLAWDQASDDHGIAGYAVYAGTPATLISFKSGLMLLGATLCEGALRGPQTEVGPKTRLVVRAVDLAGNEADDNEGVELIAPCEDEVEETDAGPTDQRPEATGSGCAHTGIIGWLALAGLVALRRRRSL